MKFAKAAIKRSFSTAAKTYDKHSDIQMEAAKTLATRIKELCAGGRPGRVLDVGCGTGHLTVELTREFPASKIFACDLSTRMLREYFLKTGKKKLAAGDSESLPFAPSAFDVVASNLAFQWSCDAALTFAEAARVLRTGGVLAFSTLGSSTLYELKHVYPHKERLACFPDAETLKEALCAAGFEVLNVETKRAEKNYEGLFALLRVLRKIGASPKTQTAEKTLGSASALRDAAARYKKIHPSNGGIAATYELIFASARKKA
ncbi:MAG: malonyl-ACP O-methyltransferase BioC [Deltaproteobacteria bacterium]|nr:malonyl-ACP O-methyltransferase BioC [Deltaproteobacteria bacterium]